LTAIDVSLALGIGRRAPLLSLSRRGLCPQPHRASHGRAAGIEPARLLADMGGTVRGYVRARRRHVRDGEAAGHDWRDVIAALRPHTPALWRRLPLHERRRFLRHVQPYWDVLRHRCAPGAFENWQALQASGAVRVAAGRVLSLRQGSAGIEVTWRARGAATVESFVAGHVVNCTGPGTDVRQAGSPLMRQLLAVGLLRPDPLGLGIDVDERYAVVDATGRASHVLHYVGPLLKARDWEATAVPELRAHAARLARHLLACRVPEPA
jgi:uncharacterized NAD(P)/FAD-binding protein YdhS